MKTLAYWLVAIALATGYVSGQRGCPSEACDPRGLNCQPDFEVGGAKAKIAWETDLGPNITVDGQKTIGCVGNDKNVICKIGDSHSQGFVSVEGKNGSVRWYDTLMKNPRLPIMDTQGNIIATDGHFMEFRLFNGSLDGKPAHFDGFISDCSSIHYVEDPDLYFFASYKSGGMYMFDTSGMCVASFFLDVKDPTTNHTVSVWVPLSKLIVNTEMDPPCTYFIAQNNATKKYSMFAVNFNHQPPYMSMKWSIAIDIDSTATAADTRMIARGSTILCAVPNNTYEYTLYIQDLGDRAAIKSKMYLDIVSFASYDYPVGSQWKKQDNSPMIWMSGLSDELHATAYGWVDGKVKYSFDMSDMFQSPITAPTSEIMVFGYHPENVTIVFGFASIIIEDERDQWLPPGGYIIAIQPTADGKGKVLWKTYLGDRVALGPIIGHQEDMLLATVYDQESLNYVLVGLQFQ